MSISGGGGGVKKMMSPTAVRTCADGVPYAITFVIELCKMIVVKF